MGNIYPALGALTGGGTGSLDKIDGAGLVDGDAATVILDTGVYHYHLNASSGASEDSPYVISPDTNAGTKRWLLVTPQAPFSHVRALLSSDQTITASTETTIICDTEDYDTLGEYNNSTGIFTATYAGYYIVNGHLVYAGVSFNEGQLYYLNIFKDSSIINQYLGEVQYTTTLFLPASLSTGVYLAIGETIKISTKHTNTASRSISASNRTGFSIDRIA